MSYDQPEVKAYRREVNGPGPITASEDIFALVAKADQHIGQIESITLAIVKKVVGELNGIGVDDELPKSPEPPSIRFVAKQNNERLLRVVHRLEALAKDLGV